MAKIKVKDTQPEDVIPATGTKAKAKTKAPASGQSRPKKPVMTPEQIRIQNAIKADYENPQVHWIGVTPVKMGNLQMYSISGFNEFGFCNLSFGHWQWDHFTQHNGVILIGGAFPKPDDLDQSGAGYLYRNRETAEEAAQLLCEFWNTLSSDKPKPVAQYGNPPTLEKVQKLD